MSKFSTCFVAFIALLMTQCTPASDGFKVKFDSSLEVSGKKFAIKDINPDLPLNWDGYEYVTLEYKITTSQRFHIGFNTDYGYNELRVSSYVANGWNKLTIPLRFYRRLPDPRIDVAATFNQPRYTGWINLGGQRGELHGVDSIGIRMRVPIGNQEFEIRNITLHVEDPGDLYLGDIPVVDQFGQHNLVDYPEKIRSLEQLQAEWAAEDREIATVAPDYNYSRFGGYLNKQVKGTGFFRVEEIDGRWWFVDPDGYLFLSHGVDCVSAARGGSVNNIDQRENMFQDLPPEQFWQENNRGRRSAHYGAWNLYRRYGENYQEEANEMIIKRMKKWGLNTIANWSSADVYRKNQIPYTLQLRNLGLDADIMGFADVYAPGYAAMLDSTMSTYLPQNKDNPWILGYFVFNEPSWLGQEVRLCNIILDGPDRPIKAKLQDYLQRNGDTPENKTAFIYQSFDIFLQTVNRTMKKYSPNHLNLGIRFAGLGGVNKTLMEISGRTFDVMSINSYDLKPSHATMDRILEQSGLPIIIGEWHFGTVDRGLSQSLWQVPSEKERGVAYRYYAEQGFSHRGLIGTHYFQWSDQDLMGRSSDGENLNCGFVDVTDRPYKHHVAAVMETAKRLYEVHSGTIPPFNQPPFQARGYGAIPDIWDNKTKVWEGYDWLK